MAIHPWHPQEQKVSIVNAIVPREAKSRVRTRHSFFQFYFPSFQRFGIRLLLAQLVDFDGKYLGLRYLRCRLNVTIGS